MKNISAIALAFCMFCAFHAGGQQTPAGPITTPQISMPVFGENPLQVNSAAVQITGNPGPQTIYYWIVANYTVGATSPSGPFLINNAPNVLSGSNYVSVIPQYPPGAISVDLLKTSSNVAPGGACNCAVATAVTSGAITDQSNSTSGYTVQPVNIALLGVTLTNEVQSANVSHMILRQNGVFVSDLSNIGPGGGPVTSVFGRVGAVVANTDDYTYSQVTGAIGGTGTLNCIPIFSDAQIIGCSSLSDDGTNPTQIPNGAIFGANGIGINDPAHAGAVFLGQGPAPLMTALSAAYIFAPTSISATYGLRVPGALGSANQVLALTSVVGDVGGLGFVDAGTVCSTCVLAVSPGVGIAHFAGSTQTVTSSAVNLAGADVTGNLPVTNLNSGTSASSSTFWRGDGTWAAAGSVTNVATSSPVSGGPISTTGTISCPTCVAASSPGVGIAHFAGSTQTVTSSTVNLAGADVTGNLPVTNLNSGTGATSSSFWRGDGTWAAAGGTPSYPVTVAGSVTSGGIPYFSSTTVESSSALLTANSPVLGGGAGTTPATATFLTSNGLNELDIGVLGEATSSTLGFPGKTSGKATIIGPDTAGTNTNPFVLSNALQLPAAGGAVMYTFTSNLTTGMGLAATGELELFGNGAILTLKHSAVSDGGIVEETASGFGWGASSVSDSGICRNAAGVTEATTTVQTNGCNSSGTFLAATLKTNDTGSFGSAQTQTTSACETAFAPTTLSTGASSTDTGQNCLPANAIIDAVVYRITTTITTAANFTIGDATIAGRFCGTQSTLTSGTTGICFVQADQTGTSGPRQTAATKVRVTLNANPGAGAIRLIVYYHTWTAPTS
ncbi:MAG: beta strand repeat-containing protein [Terriglobales bacterium]